MKKTSRGGAKDAVEKNLKGVEEYEEIFCCIGNFYYFFNFL
jgi:hypothetical protein